MTASTSPLQQRSTGYTCQQTDCRCGGFVPTYGSLAGPFTALTKVCKPNKRVPISWCSALYLKLQVRLPLASKRCEWSQKRFEVTAANAELVVKAGAAGIAAIRLFQRD
jgi:hypothetical protein